MKTWVLAAVAAVGLWSCGGEELEEEAPSGKPEESGGEVIQYQIRPDDRGLAPPDDPSLPF